MRHEKMTRMYEGPLDPLGSDSVLPGYFAPPTANICFVACGNVTFWNKLALAIERPRAGFRRPLRGRTVGRFRARIDRR